MKARAVHSGFYTYDRVEYVRNNQKVRITCTLHGDFSQTPAMHLLGNGCPTCAGRPQKNLETFIVDAVTVHGKRYSYSKAVYVNNRTDVMITCKDHGDFPQTPTSHVRERAGCPKCRYDAMAVNLEEFIARCVAIHGTYYDYSEVNLSRINDIVSIKCPYHGLFNQRAVDHVRGNGCTPCTSTNYSQKAIRWLSQEAKARGIDIQHAENGGEYRIPNTKFRVDGYHSESKTVFEFHGDAWHGNPDIHSNWSCPNPFRKSTRAGQLYKETIDRENAIKALGYTLVVMWENDFNRI